MEREVDPLQRALLIHLLDHRGQQVRFEADQWTTEFGIFRRFSKEDPAHLKVALRALEMSRWIYRRVQYVIGYSEPKLVYSLTPSGHRKALDLYRASNGMLPAPADMPAAGPDDPPPFEDSSPSTAPPL
ncbi:MAG TPA: hypothetical protein VEY07_05295 [Thermoplasmata archaeon]|nr:hypothetical protein [Thermoplasmata archaeon]